MVKGDANNNGNGDGKLKALQDAIARIEKNYGKGAIMRLGEVGNRMAVEVIPSGSLSLDLALGVGGIPRGRTTEIFGPESSGKTTLAYHVAAEAQKQGGTVVYIDAEHAMDLQYAEKCGVKVTDLLISQPDWGEQALEIAEAVVRSGAVDLVVIDSVAALVPKAEVEGHMGDQHVGLQARLMSQALRKLCSVISNHRTALIFVNQLREKVGIPFGNPEVTPGGRALKFYATVRIDVRVAGVIKEGDSRIGHVVHARVVKNKVAPPFRLARFDILFGQGISREGELIDLGTDLGILDRKGNWYQWNGQVLGQGREAARRFLEDHPEVAGEIENCIRSTARVSPALLAQQTLECAEHEILVSEKQGDGHRGDAQQIGPELDLETWQLRN